jgi:hypothetical protein
MRLFPPKQLADYRVSVMGKIVIVNTDLWTMTSYGNGLAYELFNKRTGETLFVQGDDADAFRSDFDKLDTQKLPKNRKLTDLFELHAA